MQQYLKQFTNHSQYESYINGNDAVLPNVSLCVQQDEVHYNPWFRDYSKEYLTFEVVESGTITLRASNASIAKTISYSTDNGETWTELTATTSAQSLGGTLNVGDKVLVKGNNATYGDYSSYNNNKFGGTAKVNVCGNIMSLISGDNFINSNTLSGTCTFYSLFQYWTNLLSAENLILPATTLVQHCYSNMFYGCSNLTTAPELPATTLADNCYYYMFDGCTSLTTAPSLPATTLAKSCYEAMFYNCSSLTTAPELPATTLVNQCYLDMFYRCRSLTTAPVLSAMTLAGNCYQRMFYQCTSLITAPALPATTLANFCYYAMFSGCSSLTTAPELPATTLVSNCYGCMFSDCTNLNYIKAMFTTKPSSTYTTIWVRNVAANGTFVKNSAATWDVTDDNGIPSGWTVQTASA